MGKGEAVKVTTIEEINEFDPSAWPSGETFFKAFHMTNTPAPTGPKDAHYWQSCARWALLQKYGYLKDIQTYNQPEDTKEFHQVVEEAWARAMLNQPANVTAHDDLADFLTSNGKSNHRPMRFSILDCAPGCQFKLHAHPNVELVYCLKGTLHEIRMEGKPFRNDYDPHPEDKSKVKGPNLTNLHRPWKFDSLHEGEWLVNESGSIHKSFTATSGEGCILITLWSGSHADIMPGEEPRDPSVQDAVDTMDQKLSKCACRDWWPISQTFLPESEKLKT